MSNLKDQRDYTYLKEIISDQLKPIQEILIKHEEILRGKDGMSGMCKTTNDMKNSVSLFKWLAGISISILGLNIFENILKK